MTQNMALFFYLHCRLTKECFVILLDVSSPHHESLPKMANLLIKIKFEIHILL